MVERLLRVFNREWNGLHEAAFLLAGTAVVSQLLGLVRDRMLAHHFGAGRELDIYYAAFRIPDLLYASIASFVAVTVLIPFLLERTKDGHPTLEGRKFINSVFSVFLFAITVVSLALFFLIPSIARPLVPGFTESEFDLYVLLTRILLLSPLLLGVSNLFGSITQSLRRFVVFAAGPVLYNIGILLGIFFLLPVIGIEGVVWGVILGALLHVLIQLPVLFSEHFVPRLTFRLDRTAVFRVITLSVPRTVALSVGQVATIILVFFASGMTAGSIAVFTLAMNLQSIPLSVVGMSYSVAAFPTLARLWTNGNREQFIDQILSASRHIIFWSLPAIILFIVLRAQIVRTILGSGAFDWTATRLTAAALALFAFSVIAQNLVLLFTRAFYAMGRTAFPLIANLAGGLAIVLLSFFFLAQFTLHDTFRYFVEHILRVEGIHGTQVLMLPLGYSLGMFANVAFLLFFLRREFPSISSGVKRAFLHSFAASIFLGFVSYHALQVFAFIFDQGTFLGIFLQGLFAGLVGLVAWVFLLRVLQNRELEEVHSALRHKFWRSKPIAAEPESF